MHCFINICCIQQKQEAQGLHHPPDKQFQPIKTYSQSNNYTITLINILLFKNKLKILIWDNLNSLYLKRLLAKLGWNWPSGLKKNFFSTSSVFHLVFSKQIHFTSKQIYTKINLLQQKHIIFIEQKAIFIIVPWLKYM